MKILDRLRIWWQQRRHVWTARRAGGPLREFVYLDDVAVYSLLASRKGASQRSSPRPRRLH